MVRGCVLQGAGELEEESDDRTSWVEGVGAGAGVVQMQVQNTEKMRRWVGEGRRGGGGGILADTVFSQGSKS